MTVSAGCRLVQWMANICEVPVDFHTVNLMAGEHLTPEYVKQTRGRHCIPSIVHVVDGKRLCITESRAIARYIARIGNGNVYEFFDDPVIAAEIDELVDYEATCLYKRIGACAYPRLWDMGDPPDEAAFDAVRKSLAYIEERLGNAMHLAGSALTVADIVIANTLSMLVVVPEIDIEDYPAVERWLSCVYQYGDYTNITSDFHDFAMAKKEEGALEEASADSGDSDCNSDDDVSLMTNSSDDDALLGEEVACPAISCIAACDNSTEFSSANLTSCCTTACGDKDNCGDSTEFSSANLTSTTACGDKTCSATSPDTCPCGPECDCGPTCPCK